MNDGWISLHRKLMDKGYYKKSEYVHLWIHLLMRANFSPVKFMWNQKETIIKRGQFITGRKKLAEETGISESKIERILLALENEQQIEQQKTNLFRCITIINYDQYQQSEQQIEQPVNNNWTTTEQPVDTNNKDNNKNKDKNSISSDTPLRTIFELPYADENKIGFPITNILIESLQSLYPNLDIKKEFIAIKAELKSNHRGINDEEHIMRFYSRWLIKKHKVLYLKGE